MQQIMNPVDGSVLVSWSICLTLATKSLAGKMFPQQQSHENGTALLFKVILYYKCYQNFGHHKLITKACSRVFSVQWFNILFEMGP